MKNDAVELSDPRWNALLLVCRDCRKRSNGPEGLKPKAVTAQLKAASSATKPRPRVVSTSCLGLCPKRALAIGFAGAGESPRLCAVARIDQVAAAADLLLL